MTAADKQDGWQCWWYLYSYMSATKNISGSKNKCKCIMILEWMSEMFKVRAKKEIIVEIKVK